MPSRSTFVKSPLASAALLLTRAPRALLATMLVVGTAALALGASQAFEFLRDGLGFTGPGSEETGDRAITIEWTQLIPARTAGGGAAAGSTITGVIQHSAIKQVEQNAPPSGLVSTFNGKQVRIGGFVVPLAFDATKTNEFLLVPYVGACIHVPPPPPNQLILVRSRDAVEVGDLFDPVWVTGKFQVPDLTIGFAGAQAAGGEVVPVDVLSVGYEIAAQEVEAYE
jgi:uncharacterized protein